jgi:ABC-type transporter Mla maintaining outer membrane lipid asymmetry ATPase subunit MlaF
MLYQGRVRWEGTVAEIHETSDPIVRQFIEGRATINEAGDTGEFAAVVSDAEDED